MAIVLSSEVLETLVKAANAIKGRKTMQSMRFDIPIGKRDRHVTKDAQTGRETLAEVTSAVRVTMISDDAEVIAVAMPCRI